MVFVVVNITENGAVNEYVGEDVERVIGMMQADPYAMTECWLDGVHRYLVRTLPHKEIVEVALYEHEQPRGSSLKISKLDHYPIKEFGYEQVFHYIRVISFHENKKGEQDA